MSQVICIKNLDFFIDEGRLNELFAKFGKLLSINLLKDNISRTSRGLAFIEYAQVYDAGGAIEAMNGSEIDGRVISVRSSRARIDRSARRFI